MKRNRKRKLILVLAGLLVLNGGPSLFAEDKDISYGEKVTYKIGEGLSIGDGDNLVHIQGRLQGRFTYNILNGALDNDTFAIQRGRLKIDGYTLQKKLKYVFQIDLATRDAATTKAVCVDSSASCKTTEVVTKESTTGLANLLDFYLDYVPYETFGVMVGQFKVPFLMQQLTSSGKLQFVDRGLGTSFFDLKFDVGVALHGKIFDKRLNYSVFAMNGEGANTINRNKPILTGVRLEVPLLGDYKPSEADTEDSQTPNLGMGLAYVFNKTGSAIQNSTIAAGTKTSQGTLDAGYKYRGFSFQGAGMLTRAHDVAPLTNWGYNGQVGYFLYPKKIEVALRSSGAIFSGAITSQYEHSAGLNYYIKGHPIKLQTDYSLLRNTRVSGVTDHRLRTQMQIVF